MYEILFNLLFVLLPLFTIPENFLNDTLLFKINLINFNY